MNNQNYIINNKNLMEEWNWNKNKNFNPNLITNGSNKKVWWICSRGHEWEATINSRTSGRGCRECSKEKGTSFPEQAIYYYLNLYYECKNRYNYKGYEIDIFIPQYKIGIEYDGMFYHNSEKRRKRDEEKDTFLNQEGIRLIRIKESNQERCEDNIIYCKYDSSYLYLTTVIKQLFEMIGIAANLDINIDRDRSLILQNYLSIIKEKSIIKMLPDLMEDWDYELNGKLNSEYITFKSNQKINWKCKVCGYKWKAPVYSRAAGNGCRACSGQILVEGKNDLLSQNPMLARDWDYEENAPLLPQQITVSNNKRVSWICKDCGTKWKATVAHRNSGRGCPKCGIGKMISSRLSKKIEKEGSLLEKYPQIAAEWNYEKNAPLRPEELTAHSGKKVWWRCKVCYTEWEAYVSNRVKGHGCPTCFKEEQAKRSIRSGLKHSGSIRESNPEVLEKWDYNKNIDVSPDMVSKGSHKKVWWICSNCGCSWEAMVSNIVKGRGCPECAKKIRVEKIKASRCKKK